MENNKGQRREKLRLLSPSWFENVANQEDRTMVQSLKCTGLHTRQVIIPNCVDSAQHCNRTYHLFLPSILCGGSSDRDLLNEGIDQWYTPEKDTADRRHINNNRHVQRYTAFNEYFEGEHHNVGTIPMVFVLHDLGVDAQ